MGWLILIMFGGGAFLVYAFYAAQYRRSRAERVSAQAGHASARSSVKIRGDIVLGLQDADPVDLSAAVRAEAPREGLREGRTQPVVFTYAGAEDRGYAQFTETYPLRYWREKRLRSVPELAEHSGMSIHVIRQIEDGTRRPTMEEASTLADALRVDVGQIDVPIRPAFSADRAHEAERALSPAPQVASAPSDLEGRAAAVPPIPVEPASTSTLGATPQPAPSDLEGRAAAVPPIPVEPASTSTSGASPQPSPSWRQVGDDGRHSSLSSMTLRAFREAGGITRAQLSESSGVGELTIAQIENGTRAPELGALERLASILGVESHRIEVRRPREVAPARPATERFTFAIAKAVPTRAPSTLVERTYPPVRWIGPGETIEVEGFRIAGAMFYFGHDPAGSKGSRDHAGVIDPVLTVAKSGADVLGSSAPYWPRYSDIAPSARLAYLQWLSGGRSDPAYGICYPFIYLYGLERRLIQDGAHEDASGIFAETERLIGVYGADYSFRSYASKLLAAAGAIWEDAPRPKIAPLIWPGEEIPLDIRVHLGRRLISGVSLDADDALLWVLGLPDTRIRTPIERCFGEARTLWASKFAQRHPSGLRVTIPKRTLRFEYSAASNGFTAEIRPEWRGVPLPDIATLSAPLKWMRETLEGCADELQAYSRLLGRKFEAKETLEAGLLLPTALWDTDFGAPIRKFREEIDARMPDREASLIALRDLMAMLDIGLTSSTRISSATGIKVGAILDRFHLGIEPDVRYGGHAPLIDGTVVLFRGDGGAPVDGDRDAYRAMRTMTEVAALAAASNKAGDQAVISAMRSDILSAADLTANEKARLVAFAHHAAKGDIRQGAVLSRIAGMSASDRKRVAASALSAVMADGHATPAEIRFLEKLFKTLGLPVDDVYSAIHRGAISVDGPAMVMAEEVSTGVPLPVETKMRAGPVPEPFKVDQARLARIRSETTAVSMLLADIFEEDEEPAATGGILTDPPSVEAGSFAGLDSPHSDLLRSVLSTGGTGRSDFDMLARKAGLLPDGAIETINEWAFDRFDEPALDETGDIVEVPAHLVMVLNGQMETA